MTAYSFWWYDPKMTYPIYFSLELAFPKRRKVRPVFVHNPPTVVGGTYYSQRYTGIEIGPIRCGLVWKNP